MTAVPDDGELRPCQPLDVLGVALQCGAPLVEIERPVVASSDASPVA